MPSPRPALPKRPATPEPPCLQAALAYWAGGWAALPLCPPDHAGVHDYHLAECTSPGKAPIGRWKEHSSRLPSEGEIRAAFGRYPAANVGVAFGPASRLCGIDIDGEPGEDLLNELSRGDLPDTLTFLTGRPHSYRLLYALPDPAVDSRTFAPVPMRNADGAEPLKLMGAGSQTVMPPSRHKDGGEYRWAAGKAPGELPLAPAPAWLLDAMACPAGERSAVTRSKPRPAAIDGVRGISGKELGRKADGGPIPEGGRETTLISMAGAVRRYGATEAEIHALLEKINERCDPPLDPKAVTRLARSAARYAPAEVPSTPSLTRSLTAPVVPTASPGTTPAGGCMAAVVAGDLTVERVEWLWPDWLPLGALVCVDGNGGVGKSQVMADLAARLTTGRPMPDGSRPTGFEGPQPVLLVCCEDSFTATVTPRLMAAGADLGKVLLAEDVVKDVRLPADAPGKFALFTLPAHAGELERLIADRGVRLAVIDPVTAFMGDSSDYAKDQSVRQTLGPLKMIAQRYGCTIAYMRHWNKGGEGMKATHRGGGSLAFINLARAAVMMAESPDSTTDAAVYEFAWLKGNLAKPDGGAGLQYRIVTAAVEAKDGGPPIPTSRIEWLGRSPYKADEVAGDRKLMFADRADDDEAAEWLHELLRSHGSVPAAEVRSRGRKEKIKPAALEAAAARLKCKPAGGRGPWRLPDPGPAG